ncbi:hypothetical protein DBA29_22330 [Xenophilus aerolatus]|nr:hypothetical protein [Xenophilus aerolatus]
MSRRNADEEPPAASTGRYAPTIHPSPDRAASRARLIELIARQLVHQTLQERNASLPVRPIQH